MESSTEIFVVQFTVRRNYTGGWMLTERRWRFRVERESECNYDVLKSVSYVINGKLVSKLSVK